MMRSTGSWVRWRHNIMAKPDFQVVFDGQLVEGADPSQVKANIAKLFKMEVAKAELLFSGRRTVIKRGLDQATAQKFQIAFERAGAVAIVVNPSETTPSDAAPTPAETPTTESTPAETPAAESTPEEAADDGPSRMEIAEAGRAPPPLIARGLPSAPDDMTMAYAGAMLVDEPSIVEAPSIDTSHLTLSEPGVDLTEHEKVAAPEFDLSAFELAPPGTALGEDPSST